MTALTLNNSSILPGLLKRRSGNAGLECANPLAGKFSLRENEFSDGDHSQDPNLALSDEYMTNASDDDLCPVGDEMEVLEFPATDSDDNIQMDRHVDYTDDETTEIEKIEKILKSEKAITARQSNKNKLQIRDLEYHKKSFKKDKRSRVKTDDYLRKSYRNCKLRSGDVFGTGSRRKKHMEDNAGRSQRQQVKANKIEERYDRKNRNSYRSEKRRKSSMSDLENTLMLSKRNSESDTDRTKCQVFKSRNRNSLAIALQKCNGIDGKNGDLLQNLDDSETEYGEDAHLMQSLGIQMRSGSSRSKRSYTVDVGTQISTQEMATQTDPHDYNGGMAPESTTSNQGTQMTPPLHIRLINKGIINSAKSSCQLRENYSYSSLTDQ